MPLTASPLLCLKRRSSRRSNRPLNGSGRIRSAQKAMQAYEQKEQSLRVLLMLKEASAEQRADLDALYQAFVTLPSVVEYSKAQSELAGSLPDVGRHGVRVYWAGLRRLVRRELLRVGGTEMQTEIPSVLQTAAQTLCDSLRASEPFLRYEKARSASKGGA